MRAASNPTFPELELAITRFLADFQSIISEHVQRAVKKTLGSRRRGPKTSAKRAQKKPRTSSRAGGMPRASGTSPRKSKAAGSRAKAGKKAEQLSLF